MKIYIVFYSIILVFCIALFIPWTGDVDHKSDPNRVTPTYLLDDYHITNTAYTWKQAFKYMCSYPNTYLSSYDMRLVYDNSKKNKLWLVFTAAIIEFESNLIRNNCRDYRYAWRYNRAMAYGMDKTDIIDGKKVYRYGTFHKQLSKGLYKARTIYNTWEPGKMILYKDLGAKYEPENAATYLLCQYRPFYSNHDHYNWGMEIAGNQTFVKVYRSMLNDWLKLSK